MTPIGNTAIILPPAKGDWNLAAQRVAGLPLLSRILLSAERAGVRRVVICAGEAIPRLQALVAQLPLQSRLQWIGTSHAELARVLRENGTSPCFFIHATTLLTPAVFTGLQAAFRPGVTLVVPAGQGPDGPVVLRKPEILNGHWSPPEEVALSGDAVYLDLATTTPEVAEEVLYRALGKSTDSWVIRWSRVILSPLMRRIVDTPLTPNYITLLGFLIGLVAIGCLWQGDYPWTVTGALLFVVAYLTDLLDGMLARLKLQESRWGRWMDYVLDNLVHLGIFAAIARTIYLKKPEQTVLALGALVLAGAVISGCIVAAHMIQARRPVNRLLAQVMHRDFSLIVLLAALTDRLEWFLWAAAVGINLFWPFVLYLAIRERRVAVGIPTEHPGLSDCCIKRG
ncbi:MAG: CDP-alcohol phosphatidyltransferase family protein [Candidatus Methylomirabilales bacterium]